MTTLLNDENALWMSSRLVVAAICIANASIQWRHVRGEYSQQDLQQIFTTYNYLGGISFSIGLVLLMSGIKFGLIPILLGGLVFAQELILLHVPDVANQRYAAIGWTSVSTILSLVIVYKAYMHHEQMASTSTISS